VLADSTTIPTSKSFIAAAPKSIKHFDLDRLSARQAVRDAGI